MIKATQALLLAVGVCALAPAVIAGIVFVPVGGQVFENVELADVAIGPGPGGMTLVRTTGLTGRLTEAPGGTGAAGSFIRLTQEQELLLDVSKLTEGNTEKCGTIVISRECINAGSVAVQGRARGTLTLSVTGEQLQYQGDVNGTAQCVARSGRTCSQLVINLSVGIVVSDPNNPGRVGLIRMEQLGSLVRDGEGARWATLDANVKLGGNETFIRNTLTSVEGGEDMGFWHPGMPSLSPTRSPPRAAFLVGKSGEIYGTAPGRETSLAAS